MSVIWSVKFALSDIGCPPGGPIAIQLCTIIAISHVSLLTMCEAAGKRMKNGAF